MTAEGIVLVTGGSRGIGAATATLLAAQGRRVVVTDIKPEPLAGTNTILWPAPFDVASESAVVQGIADIEAAHGPITGLVNAAGVFGKMHPAARVRMENWDREINIDLRGTFLVARGIGVAILPRLTLAAGEGRVAVRELPGRSPARQVYAVARESGVRRPSVAVILTALTAAASSLSRHQARRPADPAG